MDSEPGTDPTRRRFLTGVVGGAVALTGATVAAVSIGAMTSNPGSGGGLVGYRGMRNVTGPAPRALPQVPVAVDDEGYLRGRWPASTTDEVPAATLGGVRYSADWFRYCRFVDHPAFVDDGRDSYLRSAPDPPYEWQAAAYEPGDRLHVSGFSDYETWDNGVGAPGLGKPAMATWRSQGAGEPFHVQVLRSSRVPALRERGDEWLRASTDREFVAWAAHCTYACAVTAFKAYEASEKFGAGDLIYCPEHQSLFDPFDVVDASFVAPEVEGGEDA